MSLMQSQTQTLVQCLVFRVGDAFFAMEVGQVVEVLGKKQVNPVPEMPEFVSGVMDLRGMVVPVVDMRKRLTVTTEAKKPRQIVVRSLKERVALVVDEVKGIYKVPAGEVKAPPQVMRGIRREYLRGFYKSEALGVVMLLETDKILTSQERIELEAALSKAGEKARA